MQLFYDTIKGMILENLSTLNPTTLTFISVIAVSLLSLVGIIFLFFSPVKIARVNIYLVSLAAGSLLGNSIFHLFPESVEKFGSFDKAGIFLLFGILLFFVMEKILNWRHEHHPDHIHPVGKMSLIADGVHNFFDGILIASAYLVNPTLGISTTLAVMFHEIPQELGEFGVLLNAKYTKKRALLLNFISALTAVIGAALAISIQNNIESFSGYAIAILSGAFIYIAVADLLPELHHQPKQKISRSVFELGAIIFGITIMFFIR